MKLKAEGQHIEYKQNIDKNGSYLKDIVAFLNSDGGTITFGVDDDLNTVGIDSKKYDELYESLTSRLLDGILPKLHDEYIIDEDTDANTISITISNMSAFRPYYLAKKGLSTSGVFIRVGSSSVPCTLDQINEMSQKAHTKSISKMPAKHNLYEFDKLRRDLKERDIELKPITMLNKSLITRNEDVTILGALFADENSSSISFSKFSGTNKTSNLLSTKDVGNMPLNRTFLTIMDEFNLINDALVTDIRIKRVETHMYNIQALRELTINALVHNDYTLGYPKFIVFSDHIEISSFGGLVRQMSKEAFFEGRSRPRNQELVDLFRLLNITESVGRGIPKVIEVYGTDIFTFLDDELIVNIPKRNIDLQTLDESIKFKNNVSELNETQTKILNLLEQEPELTTKDVSSLLKISLRSAQTNLKFLLEHGHIVKHKKERLPKYKLRNNDYIA